MDWRRWFVLSGLLAMELILTTMAVPLLVLDRLLESNDVIAEFITMTLHQIADFDFPMILAVSFAISVSMLALAVILVECFKICVLAVHASLIVQAVCNQIWDHRNTTRVISSITLRSRWKPIANISFENVNGTGWFYPVVVCDQNNEVGDPFSPLISVLHLVEIRRHSLCWDEFVLWKVSALNGNMKIVHTAHLFLVPLIYDVRKVVCFESDGLIGVFFKNSWIHDQHFGDLWYFYDTRTDQWASYERRRFAGPVRSEIYTAMWCLGRTRDREGTTIGWKIRLLYGRDDDVGIFEPVWKACLVNSVIELATIPRLISQEEIRLDASRWSILSVIRTSNGEFGIWSERFGTAPVMLYNFWTNTYDVLPFRRLQRIDRQFSAAYSLPMPKVADEENSEGSSNHSVDEELNEDEPSLSSVSMIASQFPTMWPTPIRQYFCPILLNGHECIRMMDNNGIYRTQFQPSSMKRIATRAVFHDDPNLHRRVTADQFRRITGMNVVDAHFADAGRHRWPSIVWGLETRMNV